MRFPSRLPAILAAALFAAASPRCAHALPAQAESLFPPELPDRAQLIALMNAFVTGHRSCSFQDLSGLPPATQAPCLGPTAIWAGSAAPMRPGEVWVYVRQLKAPRNEYALEAHHTPDGWVITSIWLIDA